MKTISSAQMREMDRLTISEYGVPGERLMDRAGEGVARVVQHIAGTLKDLQHSTVLLIAGRGNNGGDAFVAARYLHQWGFSVEVWLAGEKDALHGDALAHMNRLMADGIAPGELSPDINPGELARSLWNCGIVVDGILGTGINGAVHGIAATAIRCINILGEKKPVVSIDVPSGLNADSGAAEGDVVRADITATMAFPKTGLVVPEALDYVGALEVIDIGIPASLADGIESELNLVVAEELKTILPRRGRNTHKGTYGHVLLIGGAPGYAGSIALAAGAALRSGAGLVTVIVPSPIWQIVAGLVPEAMVHEGTANESGSLSASCLSARNIDLAKFDSILAGPGMTLHQHTGELVTELLAKVRAPLVLDADALNMFSGRCTDLRKKAGPLVLTPHPGEAARLVGSSAKEVQDHRIDTSRTLVDRTGAVVLLKGAGTLVAAPDRVPCINLTGNPGMACGGMGDVLGGLLAGILAQGCDPFQAACLAAYLHGSAGDHAARKKSMAGLTAGEVVDALSTAFKRIAGR